MPHQKHTKHAHYAPSMQTECDYLNGWIKKKTVRYTRFSPKMVNPRDKAGNTEEEETCQNHVLPVGLVAKASAWTVADPESILTFTVGTSPCQVIPVT